jgi:hypothetical protein
VHQDVPAPDEVDSPVVLGQVLGDSLVDADQRGDLRFRPGDGSCRVVEV